jgi:hypothetical protein
MVAAWMQRGDGLYGPNIVGVGLGCHGFCAALGGSCSLVTRRAAELKAVVSLSTCTVNNPDPPLSRPRAATLGWHRLELPHTSSPPAAAAAAGIVTGQSP